MTRAVRPGRIGFSVALGVALSAAMPSVGRAAPLHDEIERVAQGWQKASAAVFVAPTRFLNDDQTEAFLLPELGALPEGRCTTVLFLGSRGLGFHVTLDDVHDD